MGVKSRTERLERRAGAYSTELLCEECGERIKVPQDIALRLLTAEYKRRRAERRGEALVNHDDPAIMRIVSHPHNALVDVRTGNPPGLPRGW